MVARGLQTAKTPGKLKIDDELDDISKMFYSAVERQSKRDFQNAYLRLFKFADEHQSSAYSLDALDKRIDGHETGGGKVRGLTPKLTKRLCMLLGYAEGSMEEESIRGELAWKLSIAKNRS